MSTLSINKQALLYAVTFFLLTCLGCSSFSFSKMTLPSWKETSKPTKIIAFWDTVIRQENGKSIRGFAARVMFYDNSNKKAVRVKGGFDVYAFDESNPSVNKQIPTKIVKFYVEDLKILESKDDLVGISYTLWVPWDEVTPEAMEKEISLFVRFTCDDGFVLMSQQATVTLPGEKTDKNAIEQAKYGNQFTQNMMLQASYLKDAAQFRKNNPEASDANWNQKMNEHVVSQNSRPSSMQTTTISVPSVPGNNTSVTRSTSNSSYANANLQQQAYNFINETVNSNITRNKMANAMPDGNISNAYNAPQPLQPNVTMQQDTTQFLTPHGTGNTYGTGNTPVMSNGMQQDNYNFPQANIPVNYNYNTVPVNNVIDNAAMSNAPISNAMPNNNAVINNPAVSPMPGFSDTEVFERFKQFHTQQQFEMAERATATQRL